VKFGWQDYLEACLARLRVDGYPAAMPDDNNVVSDVQAQSGAHPRRFGGEEGVKYGENCWFCQFASLFFLFAITTSGEMYTSIQDRMQRYCDYYNPYYLIITEVTKLKVCV